MGERIVTVIDVEAPDVDELTQDGEDKQGRDDAPPPGSAIDIDQPKAGFTRGPGWEPA